MKFSTNIEKRSGAKFWKSEFFHKIVPIEPNNSPTITP